MEHEPPQAFPLTMPGPTQLAIAVSVALIGFYHAFTVKPTGDRKSYQFLLKEHARSVGWIAAIGGTLLTLRILFLLKWRN